MANYWIKIQVTGNNIKTLQKQMAKAFPNETVLINKIENNPSRADRLGEAEGLVEDAKSIVEELKEEIDNWKDNLPENLQGSDKASQLEDCSSALEEIANNLDSTEFGSVEFPSMM